MENTKAKVEVIKPVLLKAGIPLALSVAGFICAKIMTRRRSLESKVNSVETDSSNEFRDEEINSQSLSSTSSIFKEDEEDIITSTRFIKLDEIPHIQEKTGYEKEILGLRNRIEDLEMQFLRYRVSKEHESVLVEVSNMLLLEIAHIEFLDGQISSMEAEEKRVANLVVEYVRVVEEIDNWKSENGFLQRKVKKLLKKIKDQSRIIRERNLKIEAREAEILGNCEALEKRNNVVKKLEDEGRELTRILDQLQEEKNELSEKLNSAEKSEAVSISKNEEGIAKEDHNKLVNELQQIQKERAAELEELIYLRWSNACLRHQLLRSRGQEEEQSQENQNNVELEFEESGEIEERGMKRSKLLKKFKKLVGK